MNLESLYNSMPSRIKEDAGFPQIYNQLTPDQEVFLAHVFPQFQVEKIESLDCATRDMETVLEDLKEAYGAAKNVMADLQRMANDDRK